MLNLQLFALNATETLTFPERLSEAGLVTLMGMGAIFVVLALLWACIEIMHVFLGIKEEPSATKQSQPVKPEEPAVVTQTVSQETVPTAAAEDDGALVAAITAAISAAMAEEGYTGGFRVVSFKRVSADHRRGKL